ncbi:MAG: aminotransferase class V-fold PLP-dependent enzyme [Candidatus Margulisbacteria bacterium]|nr:aminotransferase class V-fold PLP-dependent enzyme [Candidatus Margulisiibacteriota bacterium]
MENYKIKDYYPTLKEKYDQKELIYFDNACSLLKPKPVIDAVNEYYIKYGACAGVRSAHRLSNEVHEQCEEARSCVARFIKAKSPDEIIWTKNTTEAINLLANALDLKNGDEVISTSLEHHSVLLPFNNLTKKGIALKVIDLGFKNNSYLDLIKRSIKKNTKLIAITHCSNVTGEIINLAEIVKIARAKGVLVFSDEAQYIVHNNVDVQKSGVDFCAFSSTKLGGPTGLGVLYVKKEQVHRLNNYMLGGGMVSDVKYINNKLYPEYLKAPYKYEAGMQNYAGIIGLKAALEFYNKHKIYEINHDKLYIYARKKIKDLKLFILGKLENSPILSFILPGKVSHKDLDLFMEDDKKYIYAYRSGTHCAAPFHYKNNINISAGMGSIRLSFFVYNDKKEVDIMCRKIKMFMERINAN